jgi:hypothetical protein
MCAWQIEMFGDGIVFVSGYLILIGHSLFNAALDPAEIKCFAGHRLQKSTL